VPGGAVVGAGLAGGVSFGAGADNAEGGVEGTEPGQTHTTRIEEVPAVAAREGEVLVRTLEVGVCGTDREISEGLFGIAPKGESMLVLGHEALAVVERDGYGFTRGQLVTGAGGRGSGCTGDVGAGEA